MKFQNKEEFENQDLANIMTLDIYVDHGEGVRTNNFVVNLRWATLPQITKFFYAVQMRAYRADLTQGHIFEAIVDASGSHFNDRAFHHRLQKLAYTNGNKTNVARSTTAASVA
ncbi:hypothetical protein PS6_000633 [Mucor atramentarius]